MFKIDLQNNLIQPLPVKSFTELGLRERNHLQEWIAKDPSSCLGENLLIIQKEFADFSDTRERIDLLALDRNGALVIIENKLDDTGRDVTWQALKYASYCSSLSKENIRRIYQSYLDKYEPGSNAEEKIIEFLEEDDFNEIALNKSVSQRVILIAANFRKEVTSTVMWLMSFKMKIQCFKVTPYALDDQLFLNIEQIIPARDTEEFMIGLAQKMQDEINDDLNEKTRHTVRREFWGQLLLALNEKTTLFRNVSPGTSIHLGIASGVPNVRYNFVASRNCARVEIYMNRNNAAENKAVFDALYAEKDALEQAFGEELTWERLDNKIAARIKAEISKNIFDKDDWPEMIAYMVDAMLRLEKAFSPILKKINA